MPQDARRPKRGSGLPLVKRHEQSLAQITTARNVEVLTCRHIHQKFPVGFICIGINRQQGPRGNEMILYAFSESLIQYCPSDVCASHWLLGSDMVSHCLALDPETTVGQMRGPRCLPPMCRWNLTQLVPVPRGPCSGQARCQSRSGPCLRRERYNMGPGDLCTIGQSSGLESNHVHFLVRDQLSQIRLRAMFSLLRWANPTRLNGNLSYRILITLVAVSVSVPEKGSLINVDFAFVLDIIDH